MSCQFSVGRLKGSVNLEFTGGFSTCGTDDGKEFMSLEAGTPDKDSIDAMLSKVSRCAFRFHAATVLNSHLLRPAFATDLT